MAYKVADFIIGIKNAAAARRAKAVLPYSSMNKNIGQVLVKEGFLESIKEEAIDNKKTLVATLKLYKRIPVIRGAKIISKPSLRVYSASKNIQEIRRRGKHKVILSTNKGVMESENALREGIGGEVLFLIY